MIIENWKLIKNEMDSYRDFLDCPLIKCHFLCLEDRRYFSHKGIDYWCSLKALFRYFFGIKKGGGSTIEQQLVRTLTNNKEITFKRKFEEILLASLLSRTYTKDKILNYYLAKCYMGAGIVGIKNASEKIFNKSCKNLTSYEAAYIASLARYPKPKIINYSWLIKHSMRTKYSIFLCNQCLCNSFAFFNFKISIGIKHLFVFIISLKLSNEIHNNIKL